MDRSAVLAWLTAHDGWAFAGETAIAKTFEFPDFSATLGFVVRVGLAAERSDHHPDVRFGWGKAEVLWTTHDAGGVTELDLQLAEATDHLLSA